MNKSLKDVKIKCRAIQKQIFEYLLKGVEEENFDQSIKNHIQNCRNCGDYLKTFYTLVDQLPQKPLERLRSEPKMSQFLQNYMVLKAHMKKRSAISIREKIFDMLAYRIPIYQAVGGFVIVFFASLLLFGGVLTHQNSAEHPISIKIEKSGPPDLYLVDSLHQQDSVRGQNAQEDSVLIQFLVPSL